MKSDFLVALTQLAAERSLPREIVLTAIEAALASAYRKDSVAAGQDISVKLNPGSGEVTVNILKTVVEEVDDDITEITLDDARTIDPSVEIGGSVATSSIPHSPGRIAAQTAKQVVMQRLREAEREIVFEEYVDKVGEVLSVTVQRVEPRQVIVDMGPGEAVMPFSEQMSSERYRQGQRMKVLLSSVERTPKGTEIIVSRTDKDLLRRLFEIEVPEIFSGAVEIVGIAREAGARSKVGVRARQERVDPVGSCVGLRGVRIQNIVNELQGEKIDVLEWDNEVGRFIANSLNPAQVLRVELDPSTKAAIAIVPDRQLSLAIGKDGQNARLAAKLTGWNVDIRSSTEAETLVFEGPQETVYKEETAVATTTVEADVKAVGIPEPTDIPDIEAPIEVAATVDPADAAPQVDESEAELVESIAELEQVQTEADDIVQAAPELDQEQAETEPAEAIEVDIDIDGMVLEPEPELTAPEPDLASLRDVPEDVWSVPTLKTADDPGVIRFAEDITGLRGGVTVRRARRGGSGIGDTGQGSRRRKGKGNRRR
ncbi:transcription termination factor NusA [Dehalococcoidia bacterium]|nr:transcription termination factor NusA [Dehalococcoidia bacterium]